MTLAARTAGAGDAKGGMEVQERNTIDPVCGLEVDPREARFTSTYEGQTYYFTDPDCKRMFDEDPAAYVGTGSLSESEIPTVRPGEPTTGRRR